MKKILHLIETSGLGGAERLFLHLSEYCNKNYLSYNGVIRKEWLYDKLKKKSFKIIVLEQSRYIDWKLIISIYKTIKKYKIDIVHSHLLDMNFYSCIAAKMAGVKHIATEHGDLHHKYKKHSIKLKIKYFIISILTNKFVFISEYTRKKLKSFNSLLKNKTEIIYNGIEIHDKNNLFYKSKNEVLGFKSTEDSIIIGTIGNIYPVKAHEYLIEAIKNVTFYYPNVICIIIGKAKNRNYKEKIVSLIHKLNIQENVKMLGFREDVIDLLKLMDIYVMSSLSEGIPFTVLEAMSVGKPVIATRVGGLPEIIENGVDGILINSSDSQALSDEIINMIENKELLSLLSKNAIDTVNNKFSKDVMLSKYDRIYTTL